MIDIKIIHFVILSFCHFVILSNTVIVHLTFPFPTSLKKISPFPLSFRKYIVTLPHSGLRHEEQAILMRTILQ